MLIKNVKILNYKGIKNIDVNFAANKNQIEKELKIGRFKMIDQNTPIPSTSVLVGRNSIGKSTIISAISLFADISTEFISKAILNNLIQKEIHKKRQELDFQNENPFSFGNINKLDNETKKIHKEIVKSIDKKDGIYFSKYNLAFIEWAHNYHKKYSNKINKAIEVSITFVNQEKNLIKTSLSISKNGEINIEYGDNISKKKIIDFFKSSILPDRFYNIGENWVYPMFKNKIISSNYYNDPDSSKGKLDSLISNLIKNTGEKKLNKLLKLCDRDIDSIKYTKGINGIIIFKGIILENGSLIDWNDLSSGTQKFIIFLEAIIRIIKIVKTNKSFGLIVIDEIENNLHKELVQTLLILLRFSFKYHNIQSIITTHNIHFLPTEISNKQIFSINKDNNEHIVTKASSLIKPHGSLIKQYDHNLIASYPDKEFAQNLIAEIFNDL